MKYLFIFVVICIAGLGDLQAQEIIPFPDISKNQYAVAGKVEMNNDFDYSIYTKEYRRALELVDTEIETVNKNLNLESERQKMILLEQKKKELFKKRATLLEEADLIEDLTKFY